MNSSQASLSNIIVSSVITVIIGFFSIFFPLLSAFFWAAPVAVLTAREGLKPGLVAAVLSFAVLALLVSPYWAAVSAVQFGSIGLALGFLLSKDSSFGQILLIITVLALILTSLFFFFPLLQENGWTGLEAEISKITDGVMDMWQEIGFMESLKQQGVSAEEIKSSIQRAANLFVMLLPSIVGFFALGTAFFNFLAARWALNRAGDSLTDFPSFTQWWVPWYMSWGIILGLGLALLGDYVDIRTIFVVGVNLLCLQLPVALVIGFSVSAFLIRKIPSKAIKIVIFIAGFFYLPLTITVMLLVGVFDPLFDFRKIHLKSG